LPWLSNTCPTQGSKLKSGRIPRDFNQTDEERLVRITLGGFARISLEALCGSDLRTGAQAALRHYTRRLRSDMPPVALSRSMYERGPVAPRGNVVELELAVPQEVEVALEAEARANQVGLEQVVAHAVFVFLADLDSAPLAETADGRTKEGVRTGRYGGYVPRCGPRSTPAQPARRWVEGAAPLPPGYHGGVARARSWGGDVRQR
jgi:hypothetical protein